MTFKLLTRDQFRNATFERDKHLCVMCKINPAVDAHHIMERRLFDNGGYYLENGASVCGQCHMKCETTEYSVEDVRIACNIQRPCLPPHLYEDQPYDKWGNPILPNKQRVRGELFFDESVQKVLKDVLPLFTHYVKYPRTYHLPWTRSMTKDDRMVESLDHFIGQRVIVTEKMDGENTSFYSDYIHARSIDSRDHISQHWVKNFWNNIKHEIPSDWRICGENLFAQHSIAYKQLVSYFQGFSIWNEKNECLSWDDTLLYFEVLNIPPVRVLYDGIFDQNHIMSLWSQDNWEHSEGYVLRVADSFGYGQFRKKVAKFVRNDHVTTVKHHWRSQPVEQNGLIE